MVALLTPFDQRHVIPASWLSFALAEALLLLPIICAFQPSKTRTVTSAIILAAITWTSLQYRLDAPFVENYMFFSIHGNTLLNWCDRVGLESPEKQNWHRGPGKPSQQVQVKVDEQEHRVPQGFWKRLGWTFQYSLAPRGAGWSHQVKNVPQAPDQSYNRWRFVLDQLLRFLLFKLLGDSLAAFAATMPFGGYWGESTSPPQFFSLSIPLQLLASSMCILDTLAGLSMAASAAYMIPVALGIWAPHECPPLFGDIAQLTTIRKWWGGYWHLLMRRVAITSGLFFARDILNLKPGTFASRYVQLYAGFVATGLTHSMGAYYACGLELGEMKFFLLQALVIMIEDHVTAFGRNVLGIKANRLWKFIGYCWVVTWFLWSQRDWYGQQIEHGKWVTRRGTDWLDIGPKSEL